LYAELARMRAAGELDASHMRVFQLDEYAGVGPSDPRSLFGWLARSFLEPLGIDHGRVVRLDGTAPEPGAACREFDRQVARAGGLDLAILGLGSNGHLGYNEPPCPRDASTRLVVLTPESMESAAAYFDGQDVPRQALTAGMGIILRAHRILLIVSGVHKHDILRRTLFGPMGPAVPASWLQCAENVTVIADEAALNGHAP
jgi:glucosamine-6-phosphate deaminase